MRKAIIYLCVFIAVQIFMTYIVQTVWLTVEGMEVGRALQTTLAGTATISVPMLIVSSAVYSIVLLIIFLKTGWSKVSPNYLRTHPWAVLFWCAIAALGTIIPSLWLQEKMPLPNIMENEFTAILSSPWGYPTICIFAPVVEELIFRGAVLRALMEGFGNTKNHWLPIFISALLFALIHINPAQMPHAFLLGLLLGWMYVRTGSIIPGIMVHWVNNTVAYVGFNLLPRASEMELIDLFGTPTRILIAVALSLCCILLPALWQLHQRMKSCD